MIRDAWRFLTSLAGRPSGVVVLALAAAAVYAVEEIAWPMARGRDMWDYLLYYLSLPDGHPVFGDLMVFRTPVTPIVLGAPFQIGGADALVPVFGLMFVVSVVAWTAVAATFGRGAAVVTAVLLLCYTGYAGLFHQASSDAIFATGFALWCLGVVRTLRTPSFRRFAWLGVGIAVLTLTRPASQVLLVAVLLPLLVPWAWKPRLTGAAILLVAAVLPLAAWATVNWVRYDEPVVARGGTVWVPFFRIFLDDRAIDPDNGSASRRLGDAIERNVLTLPPYRRLGVDLDTYLQGGSNFEVMRLIKLSDEVFGRDDDYHVLLDAALEAAWAKPGLVLGGTADNLWTFMRQRGTRDPVRRGPVTYPPPPATVEAANGKPMPSPESLSPLLPAIGMGLVWCPTSDYARCILDHPEAVYHDPALARRYRELTDRVGRWNAELPLRDGRATVADRLNGIARRFPTPPFWLALAAIGLVVRKPTGTRSILVLVGLAFAIVLVHAVSQLPAPEFVLPVYPAFVVAAVAALGGARRPAGVA
jgi:hypothetical protein